MTVIPTIDLNLSAKKDFAGFIDECEKKYAKKVQDIADILIDDDIEILLIAGPSGSGKTTTAKRIEEVLSKEGIKSKAISLDNFYLPKEHPDLPLNPDGTPDLESPYRLDIELLKQTFEKILNHEEFIIPKFDFATQERLAGTPYKCDENEITIIEGTHALNPVLSDGISDGSAKLYVSIRTRLKLEDTKIIHPANIRLMRRLCRDCLFRGKNISSVFDMFTSVSYGEKKYISPFKKYADMEIDTFIPYEVLIYKHLLQTPLKQKRNELWQNENYKSIMRVFENLNDVDGTSDIPKNSLIREFIAGSIFEY